MKKIFIALLSVIALIAFAATSFALHAVPEMYEYVPGIVKAKKAQIELSGEIRIRGEIADNLRDLRDNVGVDVDSYNQRARLKVTATVSPNTMGVLELEGGSDTSDTWNWGSSTEGASGIYEESNSKRGPMYIKQSYIAHQGTGLTGSLSGIKAGHMLMGLGNGLFYDHTKFGDDAIVVWTTVGAVEIDFAAIKLEEGTSDIDAYVLDISTSMSGIKLGADVTLLDDDELDGTAPAGQGADLWNIGVRADAEVSGIKIKGDFEFQTGSIEKAAGNFGGTAGTDYDLSGWAAMVEASTTVGAISVGAQFAYGTGDDIATANEYEGFITSLGSGQHFMYLIDQKVPTASQNLGGTYAAATNDGLNNMWFAAIKASTNINPDTKVKGAVYYAAASEAVSAATGLTDKDMGIEIDGKVEYQLDTNIVYYVEGGYLFAGDFYKNITGATVSPDDAYSVRHGLLLKF